MSIDEKNDSPIWAILPVKKIDSAKQRLRGDLSGTERQELFHNMLRDVLLAVGESKSLRGLLVVTRDQDVRILARKFGASVHVTDSDDGQSAAVPAGAEVLAAQGIQKIITLAADVPLMTAAEIDAVCDRITDAPSVTIVPNRDGTGTNCIACSPPCAIPFAFGSMSFSRHLRLARELGIEPDVLPLPAMGLDIDTLTDLVTLLDCESSTSAQQYLLASGIAARLGRQGNTATSAREENAGQWAAQ